MCRGASEELGPQPIGHTRCLGARGDGAVAHRPQTWVLARASGRAGTMTHGEHTGVAGYSKAGPVVMRLQHRQACR